MRPALATPILKALVVAALTASPFAPLPALAASKSTARASADLPIRSGPGTRYSVIGTLKKDAAVHLEACTIGDDVLVGNGAIVLHEVVVEPWSIIAANSVVLNGTLVPSGAIAVGSPAIVKPARSIGSNASHALL